MSETPAEPDQHLKRAWNIVGLVAEVDADVADADAPADAVQPWRAGGARGQRADSADIVEAEQLQAVAPPERVLEIDERHRVADLLLEVVAEHRPDAANGELALRRQDAVRPAADRAGTEPLMGRQCKPRPAAYDVALEIEVAVQYSRRRDLRGPVDAPQRRPIVLLIRVAQALAERRLELMPAIGRFERFLTEAAAVDRRADFHRVHATLCRDDIRPERLVVVPKAEVALVDQRLLALAAPGEQE